MTENKGMDVVYNENGCLKKVGTRFAPCRGISLNAWQNQIYVHINDSSKCYDDAGNYDKSKSKSVSLKWEYAQALKDAIGNAEQYVEQFILEQVRLLFICEIYFYIW